MRIKLRKLVILAMCATLIFTLTSCSSGTDSSANSSANSTTQSNSPDSSAPQASGNNADGKITKVVVAIPNSNEVPDAPEVQDAINKITEEKYGISFELMFIAVGNWKQQSNLLLTGDEVDVIAIYNTPLTTYVTNGQLLALNDYYAGASDAFKGVWSDEELMGTSINGFIYGIPNMRNFGNHFGLTIDAEIAAEFGVENGQRVTMEEVDTFLRAAHAKYPERHALAPRGNTVMSQWSWDGLGDNKYVGVLPERGQTTEVQNLFNTKDFRDFCAWTRSWYVDGIIMQDVLSNTESSRGMLANKKAISYFDNYGVDSVAGAIRVVILEPWAVANSYAELCYGINVNSKVKDAAWQAMEILYTDTEVGVLLNDGIEGKHYVKNDNGTISYPEGKKAADSGYGMAATPWLTPYSALGYPLDVNGPNFIKDLIEFNKSTTLKSKAFGFFFDTTAVVDQYTACINVMDKYYNALMSGVVDIEGTINQANIELEAAGLNDIIAAKQEQLDAFLANK